jgi:hypothetical protein
MKYNFKDMLNGDIYNSTKVMFIFGKYNIFNNMVSDELKGMCVDSSTFESSVVLSEEFGTNNDSDEDNFSNSVNFNTFMDVVGVPNINGKWFCKVELSSLTKKQKEVLNRYIKEPSDNGILVINSTEWKDYKDYLKNRILSFSKVSHIMELSFPSRDILKVLVSQLFEEKGIEIQPAATDFFIMRMSRAYDDYESVIDDIATSHKESTLDSKQIKVYMKGIENFILDDFVKELIKPMVSDKTNSKKVLKIMIALEDELGAKNLVYQLLKVIDESIEFRVLINSGKIPIGIKYFYKDVINDLGGEKGPYGKMKEWTFRNKAALASQTSLRDWEYMKLILYRAIENPRISDDEMDAKCQKALYELCTRSVITPDRINNIIGIDNILNKNFDYINRIEYDEEKLNKIQRDKELAAVE